MFPLIHSPVGDPKLHALWLIFCLIWHLSPCTDKQTPLCIVNHMITELGLPGSLFAPSFQCNSKVKLLIGCYFNF